MIILLIHRFSQIITDFIQKTSLKVILTSAEAAQISILQAEAKLVFASACKTGKLRSFRTSSKSLEGNP